MAGELSTAPPLVLSADQEAARASLHAALGAGAPVSVLVGPAGSGKTTLVRALLDDIGQTRPVVLLGPTGKAAARLAAIAGRSASTVHRALYGTVESEGGRLSFGGTRPPCPPNGLVVCDEASMVDVRLHQDLVRCLPTGAQLLYVGDREQLPPVQGAWGPDFETPTAALEAIHRQAADSPIVQLAHAIRHGQAWDGWVPGRCDRVTGMDPVAWADERLASGADITLITATNERRVALNHGIRIRQGLAEAPLSAGDRIVNLVNQGMAGLMNGEVRTVVRASRAPGPSWIHRAELWEVVLEGGDVVLVNADLIGAPVPAFKAWRGRKKHLGRLVHVDYGFCLTVHKAQGSQWAEVGFVTCPVFRRMRDRRRLAYTAVTRAAERLCIFAD